MLLARTWGTLNLAASICSPIPSMALHKEVSGQLSMAVPSSRRVRASPLFVMTSNILSGGERAKISTQHLPSGSTRSGLGTMTDSTLSLKKQSTFAIMALSPKTACCSVVGMLPSHLPEMTGTKCSAWASGFFSEGEGAFGAGGGKVFSSRRFYPTLGKGTSSSKLTFQGIMLVPSKESLNKFNHETKKTPTFQYTGWFIEVSLLSWLMIIINSPHKPGSMYPSPTKSPKQPGCVSLLNCSSTSSRAAQLSYSAPGQWLANHLEQSLAQQPNSLTATANENPCHSKLVINLMISNGRERKRPLFCIWF